MQKLTCRSVLIPLCLGASLAACNDPPPTKVQTSAPVTTAAEPVVPAVLVTTPTSAPQQCNGTFSDGTSISVKSPVWLSDVPGQKSLCDFHTFAWNQFLYLVQDQGRQPRFMSMAPWYNLFVPAGKTPTEYPGGPTALQIGKLTMGQAGDDFELVDVTGATVRFDIRVNEPMFRDIQRRNLYSAAGFNAACQADGGVCTHEIFLPPNETVPGEDAMELKTAWRDFTSSSCPDSMYCVGHWGLVGMHLVQKSKTHGEWIWASFEHVDNSPDCQHGGSNPIAPTGPTGKPWAFFDPKTAKVSPTGDCDVTSNPPACNGDPGVPAGCSKNPSTCTSFKSVNVCRTDQIPAGGASAENCKVQGDAIGNARNVACLNATLDPQLSGPWKNYTLLGSVWVKPGAGPTEDFRVNIFQEGDAGVPNLDPVGSVHMANTTMETWLQTGSTGFDPEKINAKQAGCFLCHHLPSAPSTAAFPQGDLSHIFAKLKNAGKAKLMLAK